MDTATQQVLRGLFRLTAGQRAELFRVWNEYTSATHERQQRIQESYRVVLGPVSVGCTCCGR